MSIPPALTLPPTARRVDVPVAGGVRAAIEAVPAGRPERGTALLVPGFTGSKEDFLALLGPLSEAGWRAVAVDQRGQFESPGGGSPADYTVDALAGEIAAIAEAVARAHPGEPGATTPVHLVGHSLGGLVARAAVLAAPRRWASLALVASGPAAIPVDRQEPFAALHELLPGATMAALWDAKEARDRLAGVQPPPPDIQQFLHRRWCATDPLSLAQMAVILCGEPDRIDELARATATHDLPTLVLFGSDDDVWTPAEQAAMAARLGAAAVELPGVGHSPAAEAPVATAAALDRLWRRA